MHCKAIDTHLHTLDSRKAEELREIAYQVLQAAHSYIFMELDAYGNSEIEDPRHCAQTMLPLLFKDAT